MKKVISILIIIVIAIGLLAFFKNKDVECTIVNANNHDYKDIKKVFKMVKRYYNSHDFPNSKLTSISYLGDDNISKSESEIKLQNNADEAIELTFTFKTNSKQSKVFSINTEYTYNAVFIKKNKKWTMLSAGQG